MKRPSTPFVLSVSAALLGAVVLSVQRASAAPILTITPLTWNVVGLDSNDVNAGPNNFPVGARVCNTGDTAATNVSSTFVWDSADPFINSRPGSLTTLSVLSLAQGACTDFYFEVQITRDASAYTHTRRYHITATADDPVTAVSTPTPREIYVERLVSQNRNATTDVKLDGVSIPAGGTLALLVGTTYNIQLVASTATNGYEQLETFINFPNTIFRVNSVASTFTANGGTDPAAATKLYADGCGWVNDPNSPTYRSCVGVGKYGGNITVTYNVTIISGGGTSQTLNTLIYDFSGSSYHYNSDFATSARIAAIIDPTLVTISKSFAPDPTVIGGTSTLTFTISNPNSVVISDLNFSDTFPTSPGAMVVANPTGASTSGCGTPTFAPVAGAGSISFSNGTVAANGSCLVRVNVTVPVAGTYTNTSGNLFIDATDTTKFASDTLTVNTAPPPPACVPGIPIGQWTFPAGFNLSSPAPSSGTGTASPGAGVVSTSFTDGTNSWGTNGAVNSGATLDTTFNDYLQFSISSSGFSSISLTFDGRRSSGANSPTGIAVYHGSAAGNPETGTLLYSNANVLTSTMANIGGTHTFTPAGNPAFVRIYFFNAGNTVSGSDGMVDNVTFSGCGVPNPPTITKSFSPDPVAVGGSSTLTFTITNPNSTVALSGIAFSDTLPAGVTVATGSAAACGGTLTRTAPDSLSFSGGSLAAGASCMMSVTVTVTTAGPHDNVSGYVSATESGQNTGTGGSASDSITALSPPSIAKLFAPNPILTGGISTLTFTITNPNPDNSLSGLAFSDTFPTSPGAMVVASPTGATTSGCGSPTYAPVAGAGSITFSGGTIAAGGTCTVEVDVTAVTTGDYDNTSGSVSGTTVGAGNTASDTLTVQPVHPGVSVLKRVSTSSSGPWTTFIGVVAGSNVFFQMTVENIGDVPLTSVSVTDPALTGQGVDLSSCAWASLAVFEVQTCVVGPVAAVSGSNSNTATAHGTFSATVYDSTPSTASYATTGLTLAKSVAESFYTAPGNVLNYSYLVINSGSATLAGPVVVSDDRSSNESCPDLTTVGDLDAFLDPGESITCTATYTITADDVTAGSVTNIASATAGGVSSNTDSETVFVNQPELGVSKANDVGGSVTLPNSFTWTLSVTNVGPAAANFVDLQTIVSDPLPAGPAYGAPTAGSFTSITNSANIACSIVSDVLTCAASGATVTIGATNGSFTVSFTVTPVAAGFLSNTATVDPAGVVTEAIETNNTGSDSVTATATPPDPPSIAKAFSPSSIPVGSSSTLTFTLTNPNAGVALTGVAFSDTLPAGATVVSSSSAQCGGTLTLTAPDSIDLSGGTIAAGGSCAFGVTVNGTTSGSKVNTSGTVTSTNGGSGNTASDTLLVVSPPSIAKAFAPSSITAGATSTLTFTLTNPNAGVALTGVGFSDTFPTTPGAMVVANPTGASTSGCGSPSYSPVAGAGSVAFSGGTIASGGTCTVTVDVTASSVGDYNNTSGAVSAANGGAGNSASDTLTVSAATVSDPAVTKTGSPATAQVGDTVTFTIVVSNEGNSDADNVVLTDPIPNFLDITAVSVTPSPPSCPALSCVLMNTVTLDFGTVSPGEDFMVTITTVVNSLGAPPWTNQANVTTTSSGDVTANNTASFSLTIVSLGALEAPETGFAPGRATVLPDQPQAAAYQSYVGLRLEIPALGANMQIVGVPLQADGWDVTWLSDQAGYLAGTAFPTWTGNSVITGHATLPSGGAGPFAGLQELRYGDQIVVEAWGMRYVYEVRAQELVRPDAPSIFRHEELAWLTLITCADFDERTETYRSRRLVRAVLMSVEPSD